MEGSGRSSFSARFFARSNAISGTPVSSVQIASSPAAVEQRSVSKTHALLQDDDLDNNPGRLLAAERERLKLRERQVCQRKQLVYLLLITKDFLATHVKKLQISSYNLNTTVCTELFEGRTKWQLRFNVCGRG